MNRTFIIQILFFFSFSFPLHSDFPEYGSNPFTFSVPESPFWGAFFVADLNNDNLPDFTFRSETTLYAYRHSGALLWYTDVPYPAPAINNYGTKHGAADVDGDGEVEVVALDNSEHLLIFDGATGNLEDTIELPPLDADQLACHVVIVNLRGAGERDALVQTCDVAPESHGFEDHAKGYYLNRSLIAVNLETGDSLWTVGQDADPANGFYEGYWGQAHGPFFAADVDLDGLDEVIGGNLVESNGTVVDLGYPTAWLAYDEAASYVDHLDGISIGNFRPDLPGLEWVVTEEDGTSPLTDFHTVLMNKSGLLWRKEITFTGYEDFKEPQHTAVGNFSVTHNHAEVWVRSRLGGGDPNHFYRPFDSQYPWAFNGTGSIIATYRTVERLPAGFNTDPTWGNKYGIEMIWTIDWTGGPKEHIAAKARWVEGHIGIFDAVTCDSVWTSLGHYPSIQARMLYVADIAGDGREEMIVYDASDGRIKVFWNPAENPYQPRLPKWEDPLYKRLKQNWNYYSPGGYTYPDYPAVSNVQTTDITASGATLTWQTDEAADSRVEFGTSPDLGDFSAFDAGLTTSHSIHIDTLQQNTRHYFRVRSANANGMIGVSRIHELDLIELSPVTVTGLTLDASDHVTLNWQAMGQVSGYHVYRDTVPEVNIAAENRVGSSVQGTEWTDPENVTGDPDTHYFYKVTAVSGLYEGDPSDVYGEYDYPLIVSPGTDFNVVGIPVAMSGIATASALMNAIPGCNGVARWDAQNQGFEQYVPEYNINNFTVSEGQAVYVNVSSESVWTLTGRVAEPVYNLVTSGPSSFNQILLPLGRADLANASDLCADIPNCNSVARWDAAAQGYSDQYDPGIPGSDFPVTPGNAYLVNVTSSGTWPASSASEKRMIADQKPESLPESSRAPHLVWGRPVFGLSGFRAFIADRPGDVLTRESPGCRIGEGVWAVQCGNFGAAWKPGEEVRVEFLGAKGESLGRTRVVLTSNPSDAAADPAAVESGPRLPVHTALGVNYPNPFNPETMIPFALAEDAYVEIRIFSLQGRRVRTLWSGEKPAGRHRIVWDGRDASGKAVSGGIYLVRMTAGSFIRSRKIILIK